MLLTVDVGNTNTVLGIFKDKDLLKSWRVKTDPRTTADELWLQYSALVAEYQVTALSICSTVPATLRELRTMIDSYYHDIPVTIVEPGTKTGVQLLVDNPKEIGADRIVNTLAAHTLFGGPAIVVDFGTSTNLDVVSPKGEFLGGGVMKSDDFENDAKGKPNALAVRQRVEMQIAFMPKKEQLKMSTQITSEWIAFEYSLVMSITLYGLIISIKWDQIDQIEITKKGFLGQAYAQLIYRDKEGETQVRKIQSSAMNLASLKDIATACGVVVKS